MGLSNIITSRIRNKMPSTVALIPDWLSGELKLLNGKYIDRLVASNETCNILVKLKND